MAEVVERNLEESLTEILYMKKLKLFNKSEINEIIRIRRNHEYSIQKRNKRVMDYDSYICTEITILKLSRFRRQVVKDKRYIDKIERQILSRLLRLHRSRIDLWMRFIKFSELVGRHMSVVRIWNRVLQVHGRTDPRLWAAAAAYHLNYEPRSKARADLRTCTKDRKQLIKNHKKISQEYQLLNRYTPKEQKKHIGTVLDELKQNRDLLHQATIDLDREKRLAWDRAYLYAIRTARSLLTEGISLNPESEELYLELVKLEINALDFFRINILPRFEMEADYQKNALTKTERIKQGKTVNKKTDNEQFMSFVTEDVLFITSGSALKLVIESVLTRWNSNSTMLELLHQLISPIPNVVQTELIDLVTQLLDHANQETNQTVLASNNDNSMLNVAKHNDDDDDGMSDSISDKKTNIQSKVTQQLTELHHTMLTEGCLSCIKLWNSWYLPENGRSSFRFFNPISFPEAVSLLRSHLLALKLYATTINSMSNTSDVGKIQMNHFGMKKEMISKIRLFLDELATSHWGSTCPDFWILFLNFERDVGDCTRLPSIRWRAQKTLDSNQFKQFTLLLDNC